jgi:hypothetical protein
MNAIQATEPGNSVIIRVPGAAVYFCIGLVVQLPSWPGSASSRAAIGM